MVSADGDCTQWGVRRSAAGKLVMRCEHCGGYGRIAVMTVPPAYRLDFCPECNGSGIASCCGDARAQPDKSDAGNLVSSVNPKSKNPAD
jgi:hypothetical protein